jgi:BlaI family transcriptional regulator, penicillinase repressor
MKRPVPDLTPAEFDVMKALWRRRAGTVAEVRAALAEAGIAQAYTTVMTLLGRLADKDAVKVDRDRQPFVYRPALRRDTVLRARLGSFLREVFDGEAEELVLHLVEDEALSPDELRRIQRKLRGDDDRKGR